jgi:tetratricopeptide (TPR) repeat protein
MRRAAGTLALLLWGTAAAGAAPPPPGATDWEATLRSEPNNVDALLHVGTQQVDAGQPEEAVKNLEKAAALAPTDARVQDELGAAYGLSAQKAGVFSKFGLARKCQAAFERAVQLDPSNPEYRLSLITYDLQAPSFVGGGKDKALAQAQALLKFSPVDGHRALAQIDTADEKYADALEEYRAALRLAPADYGSLYGVGRTAAVSGTATAEGVAALTRCLELPAPPDLPSHAAAEWRLGNLHEQLQQPAQARADYEAALRDDPKFAEAAAALKKLPSGP